MKALISRFIMPLPIFWLLVILAFILFKKGKIKAAKISSITALIWLLVISTPFVPDFLVQNLEKQYEVFSPETLTQSQKPVHILVLGAGHSGDVRLPSTSRLGEEGLAKLTEGIRLHRQIPQSIIITSGFKGKGDVAQATVSAEAAMLLGVDTASIKLQTEPENTSQEATKYKRIFGDTARLIVVTTANHMPRAMYLFRKAGLTPESAPCYFLVPQTKKRGFWFWMPSSVNIGKLEVAIHEYVGLLWYNFITV
jgi:uncharacterized SAM-binding protein YcdF (DUF218 family)